MITDDEKDVGSIGNRIVPVRQPGAEGGTGEEADGRISFAL